MMAKQTTKQFLRFTGRLEDAFKLKLPPFLFVLWFYGLLESIGKLVEWTDLI